MLLRIESVIRKVRQAHLLCENMANIPQHTRESTKYKILKYMLYRQNIWYLDQLSHFLLQYFPTISARTERNRTVMWGFEWANNGRMQTCQKHDCEARLWVGVMYHIFCHSHLYIKKKKHTPSNAQVQYQVKQQQVNKKKHIKDWWFLLISLLNCYEKNRKQQIKRFKANSHVSHEISKKSICIFSLEVLIHYKDAK